MSDGRSEKLEFGIVHAGTWGSAATIGALNGMYIDSISPLTPVQDQIPFEVMGKDFLDCYHKGNQNIDVTVSGPLNWGNAEWRWIAHAIGDDTYSGTGTHTMTLQDESSVFLTAAATLDDMIIEYESVKATGFTLSQNNGYWQVELRGIANTINVGTDATNSSTNFGNLTYNSGTCGDLLEFQETQVLMNDQSDVALDMGTGANACYPNEIIIEYNGNYARDFLTTLDNSSDHFQTSEPQRDGYPECTITMNFPEITSQDELHDFQDGDYKKMRIRIKESASKYVDISFPNLRYLQPTVDASGGAGRVPQTLVFQALACSTAPTGMSGITAPFRFTLYNSHTSAYDS